MNLDRFFTDNPENKLLNSIYGLKSNKNMNNTSSLFSADKH